MHHIHTSIISRHLVTRGNKKILHTPPPHISSSEETLHHLMHHTLAQLRTNKYPFSYLTYTKSPPTHIHHHHAPFVTHTHTTSLQLHPHTHHVATLGFMDIPSQSDDNADQMDGEAGWWEDQTNGTTTCE